MADLPEVNEWTQGIYQLETSDPVLGGPEGIDNLQGKQLANRTKWLKDQISKIVDGTVAIGKAVQLKTARTLKFKGAATGSGTYDGSADTDITLTLSDFDWDKITSGKPTTLEGYGITDAAPLFSPALEGAPTAPTPPAGDEDASIATTQFVQQAVNGSTSINVAGAGNIAVTAAQLGAGLTVLTGALTGNKAVLVPSTVGRYQFWNATTGNFTLTVKTAAGTGVVVTQAQSSLLFCDGVNVYLQQSDFINPTLRGTPTAPKAPRFDIGDQVMTAAAVQARGLQYSGFYSHGGAVPGNVSHVGGIVHFTGAGFPSYSLPDSAANNIPPGSAIRLHNWSVTNLALAVQGADKMQENNDTASSAANRSIPPDTYVDCLYIGSGVWMLTGTGVAGKTRQFGALLAPNGFQRLPSGLLMQWMTANFASAFKGAAFNLPAAFPNQFFGCSVSLTDSAIYDSTGQPFVAGMPNGLGQVLLQSNYTASQSAVRVLAFGI